MNTGQPCGMLLAALVILPSIAGVALFQSGLVRQKNQKTTCSHVLVGFLGLAAVWLVLGISLVFGTSFWGVIGIPRFAIFDKDPTFMMHHAFYMLAGCVAPLLVAGAAAERMSLKMSLGFIFPWVLMVQYPVMHATLGSGSLSTWGVIDGGGFFTIHLTTGLAGLVLASFVKRRDLFFKNRGHFEPHAMPMALIGTVVTISGMTGFHMARALSAGLMPFRAMVVTQVGVLFSGLAAIPLTYIFRRPLIQPVLSGMIAGVACVAASPATFRPGYALITALLLGTVSALVAAWIKNRLHVDDAFDVFATHAVPAALSGLLVPFIAPETCYGTRASFIAFGKQLGGVAGVLVYTVAITWLILYAVDGLCGIRVSPAQENLGLDASDPRSHGELQHKEDMAQRATCEQVLFIPEAGGGPAT